MPIYRGSLVAIVSCVLLSAGTLARGGTFTWNNTTGAWSAGANWGGAAPTGSDATDILNFGGAGALPYTATNDSFASPFLLNQIVLNSSATVAEILAGNQLRFAGSGAQILQNGAGAVDINMDVDVGSLLTTTGNGVGNVTLNGSLSGNAGITKTGTGTLRLGTAGNLIPSNNTFSGGFTINDGILRFNNNADAGPTALRANRITFSSNTAELRVGASNNNNPKAELRTGELSGNQGTVTAQNTSADGDGLPVLINTLANATFGGTLAMQDPISTAASQNGDLTVRGIGTQTLTGTLLINGDVSVGSNAGVVVGGTATMSAATRGAVVMRGGSFALDNTTVNSNDRLRNGAVDSTGLETIGGGRFSLIGNAAGTTESIGRLQMGASGNERSGALTIDVTHKAGNTAPTILSIASLARDSGRSPRDTVDFTAHDANGNTMALGLAGNNPRVLFAAGLFLQNGLLTQSNVGPSASSVGYATVNGTDFATYDTTNGIGAVTTSAFPGATAPAANALLGGNGTINVPLLSFFDLNSLKIAPSAAGQSLSITNGGDLRTNGILLAGNTDYSIVNSGGGTGGLGGVGGPRFFHINSAALTVAVPVDTSGFGTVKSGNGTLVLTNTNNVNSFGFTTINAGVLRAGSTTLPAGQIEMRGGVLELTGGGTFSRTLGLLSGNIGFSHASFSQDQGGGGFSAFGANIDVDLNTAGASDLAWEDTNFIQSGYAFTFGSTSSNARLTFVDNLNLTQAGVGNDKNYNAREIRVIDNPGSAADFTRFSGVISGSIRTDLMKSGTGTLELTGTNTLQGGIIIAEGSLLTNNASGLGAADAAYILLGARGGNAASSLLASNTTGSITIARNVNVQSGTTGNAVLGNTIAPDATTAGNVNYTGALTFGISGDATNRNVQLTAAANSAVTFSGPMAAVPGYAGVMNFEKVGAGVVNINAANSYAGSMTATSGTLNFGATEKMASLTVSNGANANLTTGSNKVIVTNAVNVGASGKLDLTNNGLIVDYTGASPLATIRAQLISGYGAGKNWTGTNGITSSAGSSSGLALGYAEASAIYSSFPAATFGGQSVDNTTILVRSTLYGDSDLNGTVAFDDLNRLLTGYGLAGGWVNGDFDYSGTVEFNDLNMLLTNYGLSTSPLSAPLPLSAPVPEPSTCVLALVALLSLAGLRRRAAKA